MIATIFRYNRFNRLLTSKAHSAYLYLLSNMISGPRYSQRSAVLESEREVTSKYNKIGYLLVLVASTVLAGCSLISNRTNSSAKEPLLLRIREHSHAEPAVGLTPPLPILFTPEVTKEINFFTDFNRRGMLDALERIDPLYDEIVDIFISEGVHPDLIYLGLVESGFNRDAKSPAGARGMWQFMKSTARNYGLEVSIRRDERRDPILASRAAARHLRDLFNIYGDWFLALAAYNMGSGGVNRLIKREGHTDFWLMVRQKKVNAETSRFVAKVVAVGVILSDPDVFGLIT